MVFGGIWFVTSPKKSAKPTSSQKKHPKWRLASSSLYLSELCILGGLNSQVEISLPRLQEQHDIIHLEFQILENEF